jgi:hypothetical protein
MVEWTFAIRERRAVRRSASSTTGSRQLAGLASIDRIWQPLRHRRSEFIARGTTMVVGRIESFSPSTPIMPAQDGAPAFADILEAIRQPIPQSGTADDGPPAGQGDEPAARTEMLNDAVYRPGIDDASLILAQGGARPGGRPPGMGHNRPPPDQVITREAFPNLPNSPTVNTILAPIDGFLGLSALADGANLAAANLQYRAYYGLNRQIDPNYRPEPQLQSLEAMSWQGRNAVIAGLQRDLAGATHRLQSETVDFLQRSVDAAYAQGVRQYEAGRLNVNLSREEAIGNFMDRAVRNDLRDYFRSRGVSFGPGQYVTVNNRDYANDGSYRIPDAAIGRISIDWTLTPKNESTPQVQGFFNAQRGPIGVIIIRPTELGGSYYLANPAASSPQR